MLLFIATQNEKKYLEARAAISEFSNIDIRHLNVPRPELKDDSVAYVDNPLHAIAAMGAQELALQHNCPVIAEDAGIFFEAYDGFPSLNTKWVIKKLGYNGIMNLLHGQSRNAYFCSAVSLCFPGEKPLTFEGRVTGRISTAVAQDNPNCMDYDRIFIPTGFNKTFSEMLDVKNKISHRRIAFQKLGHYVDKL